MEVQEIGLKRNTIDKFYTKLNIVSECISYVKKHIKINENDIVIEPSAGDGAFINEIEKISKNNLFIDIEPNNDKIFKENYLQFDSNKLNKYEKIHIIGNPPFGRQSSTAIKFIKKSCEFCDSISFILPRSFKKDSLRKNFPLNFHLIFEIDLSENSFLVNKKEYNVPCIFQIWIKKDSIRYINPKMEPINFKFVKKNEEPDISFRRVGVNAGKIDINIIDKSIQSHYFIKFKSNTVSENIKKLSNISFIFDNTVGPKSISKQELISKFNPILENNSF